MMAVAAVPDPAAIARALGQAKATGGGWSCRCPAHDDKHASLSLTLRDGRLLWRCHAGCPQPAVQEALAKLGHVSPPRTNGHAYTPPRVVQAAKKAAAPEPIGRIVAKYDYIDATGVLLFQVVRFEPKTFRQRRPKGPGWEWGLGRTEPIIYRLPEVLTAETVFVVEGEKDADRLVKIGLCGTSSPMGAGKWRPSYGAALAQKHVVILPDNDEPGRKHAEDVAASARQHGAASIRIVALPKLPEKGDVSDWLDAGNDRGELEKVVRATPLWGADAEAGDPGWRSQLICGDQGPQGNEANAELALTKAPELVGRVRFDGFRTAAQCRAVPWDPRPEWRDWEDADNTDLAIWLQRADVNIRPDRVDGVVTAVGRRREHHPVRSYIEGLKWDGVSRVDDWLISYLGCSWPEERPELYRYLRGVGKRWLISAVARVFRPGCKVDCALILEGKQGEGKSSIVEALCGRPWFADEISPLGSKDAAQDLRGKWIIELAELSHLTRSEIERIKAFMSRSVDHYRPSYGRRSIDVPRQCVFIGSTNRSDYLKDETGNRRWWPVRVGAIKMALLKQDRDQIWAEAAYLFAAGEKWWLTKEEEAIAAEEQRERLEPDAWGDLVDAWLSKQLAESVQVSDVLGLALNLPRERWGQAEQNRVARHLRIAGFVRRRMPGPRGTKRPWAYFRDETATQACPTPEAVSQ